MTETTPAPHRSRSLLALGVLLTFVACRPVGGGGAPVAEFEMIDLQAPAMFNELARGLGRPHLLELPPRPVNSRHELRLTDTDEVGVLQALVGLDPSFQYEWREGVILFYPAAGEELDASPFSTVLESFRAEGGVYGALKDLVIAGLPADTVITASPAGQSRPIRIDMQQVTVRDVLAEIAAQAALSLSIEPGTIRMDVVVEPR